MLSGLDLPLILAATDPIDSIHRSVNTYPHLLDDLYAAELRGIQETYELRVSQRRASADIADDAVNYAAP